MRMVFSECFCSTFPEILRVCMCVCGGKPVTGRVGKSYLAKNSQKIETENRYWPSSKGILKFWSSEFLNIRLPITDMKWGISE